MVASVRNYQETDRERAEYPRDIELRSLPRIFRRSLFVYAVDVGNSNALNIEVAALRTPQYNIHRLGIFFTDTPRHADLLLVLGRPTLKTAAPLLETVAQLPRPFGIIHIFEPFSAGGEFTDIELPNLLARIEGLPDAARLLGILVKAKGGGR